MKPKNIVMMGGGYTTLWAYRGIVKSLKEKILNGEIRITVVCPLDYHVFHGWTGESIAGIIQTKNRLGSLKELMPLATIIKGKATHKDLEKNTVSIENEAGEIFQLAYDQLLIATGSKDKWVNGSFNKYIHYIKDPKYFETTCQRIDEVIYSAGKSSPHNAKDMLWFLVAGAGFAGVEVATNLAEYINFRKKQFPALQHVEPTITLVYSSEKILPEINERFKKLRNYASSTLRNYRIDLVPNTKLISANAGGAYLSWNVFIPAKMVICTAGQQREFLAGSFTHADTKNRLVTDKALRLTGYKNVWSGGDTALVNRPNKNETCPTNALWAIKHGERIGKNMVRAINGKEPLPFTFPGLGQSASFGMGKAISEIYGLQFTGWAAWILRWFFFHYFMPSKKQLWGCLLDWAALVFKPSARRRHFAYDEVVRTSQELSPAKEPVLALY